eukprot:1156359-Pelagomonas_calceolata.AAC.2
MRRGLLPGKLMQGGLLCGVAVDKKLLPFVLQLLENATFRNHTQPRTFKTNIFCMCAQSPCRTENVIKARNSLFVSWQLVFRKIPVLARQSQLGPSRCSPFRKESFIHGMKCMHMFAVAVTCHGLFWKWELRIAIHILRFHEAPPGPACPLQFKSLIKHLRIVLCCKTYLCCL